MSPSLFWDFWAKHYEKLWVQRHSLTPTRRRVMTTMMRRWSRDASLTVLDVGCGIGELLQEMGEHFPKARLHGVDGSQGMLHRARSRAPRAILHRGRVEALSALPLEGPFQLITCTHSLPYYADQHQALRSMAERLAPDGRLMVAFASGDSAYDRLVLFFVKLTTGSAAYPSRKAFKALLEDLLEVEEEVVIRERPYMPSIAFYVLRRKKPVEAGERKLN